MDGHAFRDRVARFCALLFRVSSLALFVYVSLSSFALSVARSLLVALAVAFVSSVCVSTDSDSRVVVFQRRGGQERLRARGPMEPRAKCHRGEVEPDLERKDAAAVRE